MYTLVACSVKHFFSFDLTGFYWSETEKIGSHRNKFNLFASPAFLNTDDFFFPKDNKERKNASFEVFGRISRVNYLQIANLGTVIQIKIHCQSHKHYLVSPFVMTIFIFPAIFFLSLSRFCGWKNHSPKVNVLGNGFECHNTLNKRRAKFVLTWHKLNFVGCRRKLQKCWNGLW